jgi:hypothetical protein
VNCCYLNAADEGDADTEQGPPCGVDPNTGEQGSGCFVATAAEDDGGRGDGRRGRGGFGRGGGRIRGRGRGSGGGRGGRANRLGSSGRELNDPANEAAVEPSDHAGHDDPSNN